MKKKWKWVVITLLFAIPAFLLGPKIWPTPANVPGPAPEQLPFFIFLSVVESLLFGFGIAFMFYGYQLVKKIIKQNKLLKKRAYLMYLAISWLLVSWWPHDNLHRVNGMDYQGLLYIEYAFHLTLVIAGIVLAYFFLHPFSLEVKSLRKRRGK